MGTIHFGEWDRFLAATGPGDVQFDACPHCEMPVYRDWIHPEA